MVLTREQLVDAGKCRKSITCKKCVLQDVGFGTSACVVNAAETALYYMAELAAAKAEAAKWRKVAEGYYNLKHYTQIQNAPVYAFDMADVDACDDAYDEAAKEGDAK